jgi:DNA ligase D-like protein (predicted polymerase)
MALRVKLTNADKVLYPASGTTKADIFDYYVRVSEVMVPHIAGRAATRKRWPNGVEQSSFFEKQLAASAPEWLPRGSITHRSGTTTYPIIDSVDGLAWIAQQAALEVHVPQWRFVAEWTRKGEQLKPGPATRLVFDLDPGEGVTMPQLAEVARAVRDLIADIGLTTFPLTSGSKGLHLYSPLDKPVSSRGAVVLAKRVAQQLEMSMPKLVTSTMTKSLRAGKVFVDWSQNNGSKTTIAPYSLRGREYPTVAAPRSWEELDDKKLRQLRYDEVLKTGRAGRRSAGAVGRRRANPRSADQIPQHARRGENTRAGTQHQTGCRPWQFLRDPGAPRPPAALRLPARTGRRAGVVGRAEESARDHRGQSPGGPHRGPSTGVRRLRGDDSEGGVRRRQGNHLGLRHLRHREVQ